MDTQLLSSGIFGITEAAKLLNIPPAKLRNWVRNPRAEEIIHRDISAIDHHIALSFINLIEAHFIDRFSRWGMHLNSIRVMADEARRYLGDDHPFARDVIFKTDGQRIFAETLTKTGDKKLYDLKKRNWAMPPILEQAFKHDVIYGPTGHAAYWYPRKSGAPNVVVNPKMAFGKPCLEDYGVPTSTISDAVDASDGDIESIAKWYEIPRPLVRQAVKFEKELITLH